MNLSTALTRIRYRIGEVIPSYWTQLELISYVNDAKDDLYNAILTINKDFFERTATLAFVNLVSQYLLASDFQRLKSIRATTAGMEGTTFIPMSRNTPAFQAGLQNSAYNNAPYQFMYDIWNNIDVAVSPAPNMKGMNITFSPTPAGAMTVEYVYVAQLPDLAGNDDGFSFLDPFIGYILDQATYYALSKGPSGDYQNYGSRAEMKLNRILAVASKNNMQGSQFVQGFLEDSF